MFLINYNIQTSCSKFSANIKFQRSNNMCLFFIHSETPLVHHQSDKLTGNIKLTTYNDEGATEPPDDPWGTRSRSQGL